MAAFVQLGGTGPTGPDRPHMRRGKLALAARARTWKCRLLCDAQNAAKAICVSKPNYQFEAKSEDRWRGRSSALAAARAAAAASAAASDTIPLDSHS